MAADLGDLFKSFRQEIESEQELREEIRIVVRDLEQKARDILMVLQKVHQSDGLKHVAELCEQAESEFTAVHSFYEKLSKLIPANEYYKYCDHYRFTSQRLVFLIAFVRFLKDNSMISREDVAKVLGLHVNRIDGFHLDLEDYLMGMLNLASELARFSVNCVTCGDYVRPLKIANFLNDLDSGFRLLNLKNDNLRKRFDALKYDVKKAEEVVYDLTIRGLKPQ